MVVGYRYGGPHGDVAHSCLLVVVLVGRWLMAATKKMEWLSERGLLRVYGGSKAQLVKDDKGTWDVLWEGMLRGTWCQVGSMGDDIGECLSDLMIQIAEILEK